MNKVKNKDNVLSVKEKKELSDFIITLLKEPDYLELVNFYFCFCIFLFQRKVTFNNMLDFYGKNSFLYNNLPVYDSNVYPNLPQVDKYMQGEYIEFRKKFLIYNQKVVNIARRKKINVEEILKRIIK